MDSEYSETNESSVDNPHSSGEDYDGIEMDDAVLLLQQQQPKPSPQVSIVRRGSQDSVTGSLRVARPPPATPRIVNHSLPPLGGYTPAPAGMDSSVFLGSVKHGRPLEAMCVDPFERKKRRVTGATGETSRFRTDFTDVAHIGKGSFSDVFRVKSRVDGQLYAIKRLKKQVSSEADRVRSEREARMHALVTHSVDQDPSLAVHIIRYHNAWFEDGRMFLQTELCPSSLPDLIGETGGPLPEALVTTIVRDVCRGLKFLHSLNLVHLDIKPANLLISTSGIFKIGDLGLVSFAEEPAEVTSGDARYLPREILLNNYKHLHKADIFSLGATALECMLAQRLEAEGEEWHRLRDGQLPLEELTQQYSQGLIQMVRLMMAPDPEERPCCEDLLSSEAVLRKNYSQDTLQTTREKLRILFTG